MCSPLSMCPMGHILMGAMMCPFIWRNIMLDLIEMTNREVCILMGMAFTMGLLFGVVLFYCPLKTKLDTLNRDIEREERCKRSARAGEYKPVDKVVVSTLSDVDKVVERSRW